MPREEMNGSVRPLSALFVCSSHALQASVVIAMLGAFAGTSLAVAAPVHSPLASQNADEPPVD